MPFTVAAVLVTFIIQRANLVEGNLKFVSPAKGGVKFSVYSGREFVYNIKVTGTPHPSKFRLKKDGDQLRSWEHSVTYKSNERGLEGVVIVNIPEVMVGFSGNYVLTIQNEANETLTSLFTIDVITVGLELEKGYGDFVIHQATLGIPFKIIVKLKGLPYPIDIRMNKTGERLSKSSYKLEFIETGFSKGILTISFQKISTVNAGVYTVMMANEIGDSLYFKFEIQTPDGGMAVDKQTNIFVVLAIVVPWCIAGFLVIIGAVSLAKGSRRDYDGQEAEIDEEAEEFEQNSFMFNSFLFSENSSVLQDLGGEEERRSRPSRETAI